MRSRGCLCAAAAQPCARSRVSALCRSRGLISSLCRADRETAHAPRQDRRSDNPPSVATGGRRSSSAAGRGVACPRDGVTAASRHPLCLEYCSTDHETTSGLTGHSPRGSDMPSCRLLRRLAEPPRDQALSRDPASDHRGLRPAGRLGMVLRRRGDARPQRSRHTTQWSYPTLLLTRRLVPMVPGFAPARHNFDSKGESLGWRGRGSAY